MTNTHLFLAVLPPALVPTIGIVFGIWHSNRRFNRIDSCLAAVETRLASIELDLDVISAGIGAHDEAIGTLKHKAGL